MLAPAVVIGALLFFVMGVHFQMQAAARSCAHASGDWVATDTIDWMANPKDACEL